ncbi:MAG TPA: glycosyltransferase family 2 protein [Candidatus Moranbacteria bacterium]|nr:glycosyltransferase family 2 protein [Candidatus Moranbacteria bacterium]
MIETSIIIRTKNEQKWLGRVLDKLQKQTYGNFEIVIIDSESTDNTLEIAKRYTDKIISIKQEDFSYPYALNIGCKYSEASKYFVMLSAHSLPISDTWLSDGISNFGDEKLAGVYGNVWALPDGTIWEKIIFNEQLGKIKKKFKRKTIVKKTKMGTLGFTNAIIRRDLWEKHHFDEKYGAGGEDGAWADFYLKKGFYFIEDVNFSVYHSHRLGLKGLYKQYKNWKSLVKPRPFEKLTYRNFGE